MTDSPTPPPSPATPTVANCPLCGGPAQAHATSGSDERIGYNFTASASCGRCFCSISVGSHHDENGWCNESPESAKARVIAAWNRRAPDASTDALQSRLAEVERDAARYRWLRSEEVNTNPRYYQFWEAALPKLTREERLDALLDKWMTMDFCEHDNDAATCEECHGQFGVGA